MSSLQNTVCWKAGNLVSNKIEKPQKNLKYLNAIEPFKLLTIETASSINMENSY